MAGIVRLVHPFPSLLDAVATAAIALLAGGGLTTAIRLGAAMLLLQASIGALNDLVDAPRDAGHKVGKPVPRGAVSTENAQLVAILGLFGGLSLATPSGFATTLIGAVGVGIGYLYDLRLSRTAWSWLPFAVGLPLLPVFAWLGATGSLPPALLVLVPIAILAGAGLELANGLADLERDRAAGKPSAVVWLGASRAWAVHAALLVAAVALAIIFLPGRASGTGPGALGPGSPTLPVLGAIVVGAGGLGIAAVLARVGDPALRERAWELEAVAVAVIGAGWLAAAAGF